MDRILEYRVKASDLDKTVNGILVKVLKHCMRLTPHEISHAKFTPGGITVLRNDNLTGEFESVTVKGRVCAGDIVKVLFSDDPKIVEEKIVAVKGDVRILVRRNIVKRLRLLYNTSCKSDKGIITIEDPLGKSLGMITGLFSVP